MSAAAHLATLGFSMGEAKSFLLSNLAQPELIFSICKQHGVTTPMIAEIAQVKESDVMAFFWGSGIDPSALVPLPAPKPSDLISDLSNEVQNSGLWSDLGDRIEPIDLGIIKEQQVKISGVFDSAIDLLF